nr:MULTISPECIES: hypothetical protein [Actinomycetes]
MAVGDLVDEVIGVVFPDDPAGVVGVVKDLITLRNAVEARLAAGAALIDRLGLAKRSGSTTSKLLQANGAAPVAAARWLRIGVGSAGVGSYGRILWGRIPLRRARRRSGQRSRSCSRPDRGRDERGVQI